MGVWGGAVLREEGGRGGWKAFGGVFGAKGFFGSLGMFRKL